MNVLCLQRMMVPVDVHTYTLYDYVDDTLLTMNVLCLQNDGSSVDVHIHVHVLCLQNMVPQ